MKGQGRDRSTSPSTPLMAELSVDKALEQLLVEVGKETQPEPREIYSDLRGQGAIITGGATGIGRAIALEFARRGVHIAFNYLDDSEGSVRAEAERTESEIGELGVEVFTRECDIRDPAQVEEFVGLTIERRSEERRVG